MGYIQTLSVIQLPFLWFITEEVCLYTVRSAGRVECLL